MPGCNLKKTFFVLMIFTFLVTMKLIDKMESPGMKLKLRNVKRWTESLRYSSTQPPSKEFFKVFHLDLKGGPPKMNFLLRVLPLVRGSGANAILVEYEDMFPFSGRLKNVSADNAYSLSEVRKLVELAERLKMEVIPLVQTFGHLEYVLKLEEFQHFRELESFPQEICPMNREAVNLVKEMIGQVMAVHTKSNYIHIGCDEVRHVGACPKCSRIDYKALFARHVTRMADYVRAQYPGVTPLIWDDMLRKWPYTDLANSGLGSSVELVVWVYGNNIFTLVPPFVWNVYRRTFPRIWVASAFKGAFGETEILPDLTRHLENYLSWMRILHGEVKTVAVKPENFSGIFLTGWSRYDHFAVLCELLPVGIPSLLLGLVFLEPRFVESPPEGFSQWLTILKCPSSFLPPGGRNETFFQDKLGNCSFPGSALYSGVVQLARLRARVTEMTRQAETSGWSSEYNVRKNFTSPWRLLEMFPGEGFAGEGLRKEISLWKESFSRTMEEHFDGYTRAEWLEQNVKPMEDKLNYIQSNFQRLMARKIWPRRPLR